MKMAHGIGNIEGKNTFVSSANILQIERETNANAIVVISSCRVLLGNKSELPVQQIMSSLEIVFIYLFLANIHLWNMNSNMW
jgi:ribose/xylose/arabinose/galactoside ABC-type transport system permease subunit